MTEHTPIVSLMALLGFSVCLSAKRLDNILKLVYNDFINDFKCACSSKAERTTHNRLVTGSNPATRTKEH